MRWTEEEEALLRFLRPNKTCLEIAQEFERRYRRRMPGFFTLRTEDAVRRKYNRDSEALESLVAPYDARFERLQEMGREYLEEAEERTVGLPARAERKILALSDMHFPFARVGDLRDALELHKDAAVVVLNGDLLDGYMFSTFERAQRVAAVTEYRQAFELVQFCSENFPTVVMTSGNHDVRPARALRRHEFEQEATQVLRPDLLARIAHGEVIDPLGELVEIRHFPNVIYQALDSWYVRVGKTVFCHPDKFLGQFPGATASRMYSYFVNRLGQAAFDSIVCAHTHRLFYGILENCLLIEQGAMCTRLPYEHQRDIAFTHSTAGYALIFQDEEGNTDFNLSTTVYLGAHLPPKKEIL